MHRARHYVARKPISELLYPICTRGCRGTPSRVRRFLFLCPRAGASKIPRLSFHGHVRRSRVEAGTKPIRNPPRSPRFSSAHGRKTSAEKPRAPRLGATLRNFHLPRPAHGETTRSSRVTRYVFTATPPRWSRRAPRPRGVLRRRVHGKRVGFSSSHDHIRALGGRPRSRGRASRRRVSGVLVLASLVTRRARAFAAHGLAYESTASDVLVRARGKKPTNRLLRHETSQRLWKSITKPSRESFGRRAETLTFSLPALQRRPSHNLHATSTCPASSPCTRPSPSSRSARSSAWASPSAAASP